MNIFKTMLLCAALLAGAGLQAQDKKSDTETVTFDVSLHCSGCKAKIEKNIPWEKGVKDLKVDLEKKQVTITYDPRKTDKTKLKAAIEKLDFTCEEPGKEPAKKS